METEGTCGVCYNRLETSRPGICCCKCGKIIHLKCAKLAPDQVSNNFTCQPCSERRTILKMLERQQSELTKISQSISTQIAFSVTKLTNEEIRPLQDQVSAVHKENIGISRELYESKIAIYGIPDSVTDKNLMKLFIQDICKHYSVEISSQDIYNCYWMNTTNKTRMKKIVVKFNNIFIKDQLLKKYFADKKLEICNIPSLNSNINSRVYLEQLLPPSIERVTLYCRKLKKNGVISKYHVDFRTGISKVTLEDGSSDSYDFKKLTGKFPFKSSSS